MSVEVERLDDAGAWDALVARADETTPFHRRAALDVIAAHSDTDLHPLVGYVGEEPAGLFPVFERSVGPVSVAFSPPPNLKVPSLGPATFADPAMKRRKRERRHRRFVESALSVVDDEIAPSFVTVRAGVGYDDPRPFVWNGFEPTPRFTYHVDLTPGQDSLLAETSSDLRSNLRKTDDDAFEIVDGGRPGMEQVVVNARRRHEEQGISYGVTPAFARDLSRAIPEAVTAKICRVDGVFAGGTIVLSDDDTAYRWQSVADFDAPVPAGDLLDWHVIRDAIDRGLETYDLVGANNRRLCGYKSKFAPDVATHYRLQRSGRLMDAVANLYLRVR
ncbi:GNAT family N-acetyltransferase [Halorubrum trueperi]|uniref:GNAT family N-acetyltransferase n=1 Tax=Halorubrum trueperi TaxID=2004704 RepID=A0ABD5UJ78_9EURY